MSIAQIEACINTDAMKERSALIQAARKEEESILASKDERAAERAKQIEREALTKLEREEKGRLAGAELAARDALLAEKQKLIGDAFNRAFDILDNLDAGAYEDLVSRLIGAAARGGEAVVFDERTDSRQIAAILDSANQQLSARGVAGVAADQGGRPIGPGFILMSDRIEETWTFKRLIEGVREGLEPKVASALFASR